MAWRDSLENIDRHWIQKLGDKERERLSSIDKVNPIAIPGELAAALEKIQFLENAIENIDYLIFRHDDPLRDKLIEANRMVSRKP